MAKILIGSKKLGGCKNGTDLLYHHAKYGDDRGLQCTPAVDEKVMFFVCHALELRSL